MKEMLRMMGLSELQLFGSWFVVYLIYFFVLGLGAAAFLSALVFPNSSFVLMALIIFLYGLCAYAFCYCLTAFFWKARTAVMVISTLWPVLSIVKVFIDDPDELKPDAVFLIPPAAFSLIVDTIAFLESQNSGLTFAVAGSSIKGFKVNTGIVMIVIDILIYMLLGAYFERVIKQEYGSRLPWHFPITNVWRKFSKPSASARKDLLHEVQLTDAPTHHHDESNDPEKVEAVTFNDRERIVRIKSLRKVFGSGGIETVAVDGISLDMYEGEILCLLGHNGAGKTTTLSILSGMLEPQQAAHLLAIMIFAATWIQFARAWGSAPSTMHCTATSPLLSIFIFTVGSAASAEETLKQK